MTDYAHYAVAGDASGRRILSASDVDQLGEALLALTSEVWILTDRMAVLEEVLKATGIDVPAAIDAFIPTAAHEKALDARRDRLIASVVGALQAKKGP